MIFKNVDIKKDGHLGVLKINREKLNNTLNIDTSFEIIKGLKELEKDKKIKCIALTGNEKFFSPGADIKELYNLNSKSAKLKGLFNNFDKIAKIKLPIISLVEGHALGGGLELCLMTDFIVASSEAKFGQPEINLGVVAGIGGTQRLTRLVGKAKSMDMHLTGRFMDAIEAESSGLVSRVVPAKKLIEEAKMAASKIAEKSTLTVMAVKEAVNRAEETSLSEGILFEKRLFHSLFATQDQKEGMAAFLEKREPHFRSK